MSIPPVGTARLMEGASIPCAIGALGVVGVTDIQLAWREAVAGTTSVKAVVLHSSWCARGEDGGHGGGNS